MLIRGTRGEELRLPEIGIFELNFDYGSSDFDQNRQRTSTSPCGYLKHRKENAVRFTVAPSYEKEIEKLTRLRADETE